MSTLTQFLGSQAISLSLTGNFVSDPFLLPWANNVNVGLYDSAGKQYFPGTQHYDNGGHFWDVIGRNGKATTNTVGGDTYETYLDIKGKRGIVGSMIPPVPNADGEKLKIRITVDNVVYEHETVRIAGYPRLHIGSYYMSSTGGSAAIDTGIFDRDTSKDKIQDGFITKVESGYYQQIFVQPMTNLLNDLRPLIYFNDNFKLEFAVTTVNTNAALKRGGVLYLVLPDKP